MKQYVQGHFLRRLACAIAVCLLAAPRAWAADGEILPHFAWRSDQIATGGRPEGDAAFEALRQKGISLVVNVDGAAPDLQAAKRHGLRYAHIPIGYDKLDADALSSMKRLLDENKDKMYVHCHHGVHRAPAFVATALRMLKMSTPEEAFALLKEAGASADYPGLWYSAVEQPLEDIKPSKAALLERCEVSSMVEAMVRCDDAFDLLKAWAEGGCKPMPKHPDFVAINAMRTTVQALEDVRKLPEAADAAFSALLEASIKSGNDYIAVLGKGAATEFPAGFKGYQKSCAACHVKYRNPK
jgi:protein tyrosine phosphatase (PTP) superfamily phosphohydrolase (DUF442 family)